MGEPRDDLSPITIPMRDLAAIGMDDIWHIDEHGIANKIGGFDHRLGWKLVDSLYSWMPPGGRIIYDPESCPYVLDLRLH